MIWALTREQVRSQWRYLLAAALVIAVTVAVAVYGALMALTLIHSQREIDHFFGYDRDSVADASTGTGNVFDDLAGNIDDANAAGHEVVAVSGARPMLASKDATQYNELYSLYGDVDWPSMLVDGSAPASGEIVVSAQWAAENGVSVGDEVQLVVDSTAAVEDDAALDLSLRVSGLSRSSVGTAAVQMYVPTGYVAWDDLPSINNAWADAVNADADAAGQVDRDVVNVSVSGNGNWPWSKEVAASTYPYGPSDSPAVAITIISGIAVAALVVGLIAMAFALGRAQAQARTKWLGTVRALGATKRQVAGASLLESAAVGLAAGIVGFVGGSAGAIVHFAIIDARVESPVISASPVGYIAVFVAAVLLAVVLALVVGAVPAFWSARVSPTAALKPVTDISDATVSRNVKVWPLVVAWVVAVAAIAIGTTTDFLGFFAVLALVATIVFTVTTIMLAHEVLRRTLPWHARILSQSRRRVAMVAGDAILARPRQSTIPAFIVALSTTVVAALFVQLVASWSIEMGQSEYGPELATGNPYIAPLPLLGVYAVVTLLCVAVAVATASVTAREAATRQALGLTASQGRLAASVQYLVAQLHGLTLGLVGGFVGGAIAMATSTDGWLDNINYWAAPVARFFLLVVVVACAFGVLGALLAAALAPKTSPLSRVEVSA